METVLAIGIGALIGVVAGLLVFKFILEPILDKYFDKKDGKIEDQLRRIYHLGKLKEVYRERYEKR